MLWNKLIGANEEKIVEYIGFSALTDSAISIPSGSQEGDLLVIFDRPIARSVSLPTGFNSLGSVSTIQTDGYTLGVGYKIQSSGDSSFSSNSSRKILAAFRANFPFIINAQSIVFDEGGASPITVAVSNISGPSISFIGITHSTGTTSESPSVNATSVTDFHLLNGDLVLGAWFGINESISVSATDSNANLLIGAGFRLNLE